MNVLQAVILGIIQGLAEFLPISSSGHLLLAQAALKIPDPSLMMTILLHLGTLVAVLIVFWRDWWEMLKNPFKSRVFWMLVLASLPAVVVALLLGDFLDALFAEASMHWLVGIFFLCTALLLVVAERFARKPVATGRHARKYDVNEVGVSNALAMGVMQGVAILPGVSRSGSTIVGGMLSGLDRGTAAKFSFMMSVPAILGSLLFEGKDLLEGGVASALPADWVPTVVGVLVAAVSGYLAIRWMLRLVQRISLNWFALYVGVLGLLVIADHFFFHLVV